MTKRCCFMATLFAFAALPTYGQADTFPDAVTVGRYTTVNALAPADVDPLAVVAQLRFPRETTHSVGDSLTYLLQRTGYSIRTGDDYSARLFTLPLPESQRQMGPGRVSTLAQAIVGTHYLLCVNRFSREIVVLAELTSPTCPSLPPSAPREATQ